MIVHFLKRDILDFRLLWIGLLVVTLLWAIGSRWVFGESGWKFLLLGYYLFGLVPQNFVLGSPWRTQHQMSRHYLLSLPIGHKTLFLIQNIRLIIFWLPALAFGGLAPFFGSRLIEHFTTVHWGFFYFGLVVSIGFMEQMGIWTMLEWERLTSYIQPSDRFLSYGKIFGVSFGGTMVIFGAWTDLLLLNFPIALFFPSQFYQLFSIMQFSYLVFTMGFLILGFWIPRNARRWCVSL